MMSSSNTMKTVKSEPKYDQYFPSLDLSHSNFKPLEKKTFPSMDLSIHHKPSQQESFTSMDFIINPKPSHQLSSFDDHLGEGIMPKLFPFLAYRTVDPDKTPKLSSPPLEPIVQHHALPTPFFSSETPPVQPVSTSTRTAPPPLATQDISCSPVPSQLPSQPFLSPKISLGIPAPPPTLSCSPHTPPGTPPLL